MTEYYADGLQVMRLYKPEDFRVCLAGSQAMARRIAMALTLVNEASDAELEHLTEAGVMGPMLKAYRQQHDALAVALADEAGTDAAFARRPAHAAEG